MKKARIQTNNHSINYYSKILLIMLVPILLINFIVSFSAISITRKEKVNNIYQTISIYLNHVSQTMNAIDHFMYWTVLHDASINKMEQSLSTGEFSQELELLRGSVKNFQYSSGKEYQFFIEFKNKDFFKNVSPLLSYYSDYKQIEDFFTKQDKPLTPSESSLRWNSLKINNKYYLYRTIASGDVFMHCVISVDDILLSLHEVNLGSDGFIAMENQEGQLLTSSYNKELLSSQIDGFYHSRLFFREADTKLPFTLWVFVDHFGAFETILIAQFLLLLMPILISLAAWALLTYLRSRVLNPIQKFSQNLDLLTENEETPTFENSGIRELEEANSHFKKLVNEIKMLKIDIYEQELAGKRIEMDFMKLQIKPHFYLNCLTTIYSMAQNKMYNEIEQMTMFTSNYFRHLLQTNQSFVRLKDEVLHVNNYLGIQKLRYGPAFTYESNINENILNCNIPPLILQTFIENTIKYAISFEEPTVIQMNIKRITINDLPRIKISVNDNGPGFSKAVLTRLMNKQSLVSSDGKHIGINNAIERLNLLYGDSYQISFSNGGLGGAFIELIYPLEEHEE